MTAFTARANGRIAKGRSSSSMPAHTQSLSMWAPLHSCIAKNLEISARSCPSAAPEISRATSSTRFVQVDEKPLRTTASSELLSDLGVT